MSYNIPNYLKHSNHFLVVITDLEGKLIYLNDNYRKNFFTPEDPIGKAFFETVHPDDIETCNLAAYQCITDPNKIVKVNIRKPLPDKTKFLWTEWEFSFFSEDEKPIGILAIGHDISEKKQIEFDLSESELRWKHAVETAEAGFIDWNIHSEILFFSEKWKTNLDFSIEHKFKILEDFYNLLDKKNKEKIKPKIESLVQGKISFFQEELQIRSNRKELRTFLVKGKSFFQNQKNILLIFNDITKILAFESEQKKTLDLLRKQFKKIKQVSHLNAHELRAPLTNILGIIEILKDEKNRKDSMDSYIDFLDASATKIDNVIKHLNDLLQSSEMEIDLELLAKILKPNTMNIFLIDDDPIQNMVNRKLILEQNPDSKLTDFTNPIEALKLIESEKEKIDLIFLDLNMPEMSGWDVIKELENLKIEIPVQILTSSIDKNDFLRANYHSQIKGILTKPLKKDMLINIIS